MGKYSRRVDGSKVVALGTVIVSLSICRQSWCRCDSWCSRNRLARLVEVAWVVVRRSRVVVVDRRGDKVWRHAGEERGPAVAASPVSRMDPPATKWVCLGLTRWRRITDQ